MTPETTIHITIVIKQQHAPSGTKVHHASTAAVATAAKAKVVAEAGRHDAVPLVVGGTVSEMGMGAGVSMVIMVGAAVEPIMVGAAVSPRTAVGEDVTNSPTDDGGAVSSSLDPAVGEGVGELVISNCCRFRKPLVRKFSSSSASRRSMRSAPSRWFKGELSEPAEAAGPAIARTTAPRVATRTRKDTIVMCWFVFCCVVDVGWFRDKRVCLLPLKGETG